MTTAPFIPRADLAFKVWAAAFVSGIHSSPYAYGLSPSDGQTLMRAYKEFEDAYSVARAVATRTKVTVAEKDNARNSLESVCRCFAALIRPNNGVSDAAKIAIGVRPRNTSHQRRIVPASSPTLNFIAAVPGGNVLHFGDSITRGKAKPFGAQRLELWVAYQPVGSKPSKSQFPPKDAQPIGSYSKNPISVARDAEQENSESKPTFWARWAGFNNDVGPWSLPCSMALAAKKPKNESADDQPLKLAA